MADTNEILEASRSLGQLVATHPMATEYQTLMRQFQLDVAAQELYGKFAQLMEHVMMKEQSGQPVELAEKTALQSLSQSIKIHPFLPKVFKAQEEFTNLMRSVQEQINAGMSGQVPPEEQSQQAAPSKIILE